jgi:hypothetical protein
VTTFVSFGVLPGQLKDCLNGGRMGEKWEAARRYSAQSH